MTIDKTYYRCKNDNLYYADPEWYGDEFTVLMDEDGEFIWTKPECSPEKFLNDLGIKFKNLRKMYPGRRWIRGKYEDSITYKFELTENIPKPHKPKEGRERLIENRKR
jgi:hypothetical protein